MKLTGKCKQTFENYLFYIHYNECPNSFTRWNNLLDSEKYGVYVDFFDSVGIYLNAIAFERMKYFKAIVDGNMEKRKFNNRNDALIFAINKANEIFNKRN